MSLEIIGVPEYTNLPVVSEWTEDLPQIETNWNVLGGSAGAANVHAKVLGNRVQFLKENKAEKGGSATQKFKVATATVNDEAVNLAQLNTKAALGGSATQKFKVATATVNDEAVNLAQLNTKAALGGSATQKFKVATATVNDEAVNLAQLNGAIPANFVSNDTRVKNALNAIGSAPIYGVRTFCKLTGTGTIAIEKAGNVSSLVDSGIGQYRANLITPISADATVVGGFTSASAGIGEMAVGNASTVPTEPTTTQIPLCFTNSGGSGYVDPKYAFFAVID